MARVRMSLLARGSFYAGLATLWQVASRIILTPVILAHVGLEGFGVWALLFGLTGTAGSVGSSFGLAYAKTTADLDAQRDYEKLAELLSSGIVALGLASLLLLGGLGMARGPVLSLAGVGPDLIESAGTALLFVAAAVVLQMSVGASYQILAGLQRTDLRYRAKFLSALVYFFAALWALTQGWGLPGLGAAYVLGEGLGIALAWLWCRWLFPQVVVSPRRVSRRGLREMFSLGGRFQLLFLVDQLARALFQVLLSGLLGPAMLGIYAIARRLINLAKTASGSVLAPLMPAFASLHSSGESERAVRTYRHGSRISFGLSCVSLGFVAAFADTAIFVWTGEHFPLAAWTCRVLSIGFAIGTVTGVATASLRSRGLIGLELSTSVANVALRLALTFPLFFLWGYEGFVLATAIPMVAVPFWYLSRFTRLESIPTLPLMREALLMPLLALAPVVAAAYLIGLEPRLELGLPPRWGALVELGVWGVVYTACAAFVAWAVLLSREERGVVAELAHRAWPRLGRSRSSG